ncbi:MAG TPA: YggS family pyridoxal phosphate-dependent enzyme [Candidatus Binatia bacterium]|nr:YggS family pyridoxal phosphate-dependent enzyme [Candidatus Binatia bacterium]
MSFEYLLAVDARVKHSDIETLLPLGVIWPAGYGIQTLLMVDIAANCRAVQDRIVEAARRANRDQKQIRLLAAAKSQSVEFVRASIKAGIRLIGENYVQEARAKKQEIADAVEWHMIGHLQRNKTKAAVELFDVIESLDSLELARAIDHEGSKKRRTVRAFIEVNLSGEASKSGLSKDKTSELLTAIGDLSHLQIEGLMTVPPFREDPEKVRPYFRELREMQLRLGEQRLPNVDLKELSMGMTHDYIVAIEEGATIVRIGTAIFGPRNA